MHRGGRVYRLVADHVGSVRLVIDVADGTVAQRIDYDEYGRILLDTNPAFQPFGFAGGLHDRDTGFVRLGARDYDPMTGRWTAKDPAGFGGGNNLYTYGSVDPLNTVDVTGEAPFVVVPALMAYARCVASCTALEGLISAATSDCGFDLPSLTADCATSCVNPLNWLKIDRAINRVRVSGDALKAARREFERLKPSLWREEAARNPGRYTQDQLADMLAGRGPIGSDGFRMELHHRVPLANGGTNAFDNIVPMTRTDHRLGGNYSLNHPGLP